MEGWEKQMQINGDIINDWLKISRAINCNRRFRGLSVTWGWWRWPRKEDERKFVWLYSILIKLMQTKLNLARERVSGIWEKNILNVMASLSLWRHLALSRNYTHFRCEDFFVTSLREQYWIRSMCCIIVPLVPGQPMFEKSIISAYRLCTATKCTQICNSFSPRWPIFFWFNTNK